jgi:hypothetical protein
MLSHSRVAGLVLLSTAVACSSSTAPVSAPSLTVRGTMDLTRGANARGAALQALYSPAAFDSITGTGDPASVTMTLYAMWISPNTDCSSPVLVQEHGEGGVAKDLVQSPVLFSGSPASGSFSCILFKASDVISFAPSSSFPGCVQGTTYTQDIYRSDNTDSTDFWRDVDLNPIAAHGTDSLPVNDHVTLILTRDTAAAIARGFSRNQTLTLGADLVVPSQSSFVWGGQGTVEAVNGAICGLEPGRPTFE